MPYVINNSRGQLVAIVQDGTINTTSTSQNLVGKDVSPYGELEMENLVHQLENFANNVPPENPIQGQLWYDTGTNILYIYTTTNVWKPVKGATAAPVAPTANPIVGDLWFDTATRQLKIYDVIGGTPTWIPSTRIPISLSAPAPVIAGQTYFQSNTGQLFVYNGSAWTLIGPPAVENFGTTQWRSTAVIDDTTDEHAVMEGLVNGTTQAIFAGDTFTLDPATAPGGFSNIQPGLNLLPGTKVIGVATQAERLTPGRTINGVLFDGSQNITVPTIESIGILNGGGIAVSGSPLTGSGNITLTNTGVISLATGSGLNVNQSNGAVFLTNTGVTGIAAGAGLTVDQNTGLVTMTNSGVLSVAAGTGTQVSTAAGVATVNNTGVTSLAAGSGISVNQANGAVTVTNSGVTQLVAGTNINITPAGGTGTVTISATSTSGGAVLVDAFGAVGNGTTDDTAAFQAAIDSLGTAGGRVLLSANKFYRIANNLTLKPSCHLQGQQNMIGSNGYNYYTNYSAIGSAIWLDPTATINMKSGSSITKMLIRQRNMTYTSPSSFSGTAITILGTSSGAGNQGNTTVVGDDVSLYDVMIMGFNQAISATYAQRLRVTQCNIDCINGIVVTSALDIPYINRVHCWPFATIAAVAQGVAPNPNGTALTRTGTAFKFQNTVDWGKITDCFAYGYNRGFWIDGCNSCELTGCGADSVPESGFGGSGLNGWLGFVVTGGSTDTLLTNCQAASQEKGFYIGTQNDLPTQLTNCVAWSNRDQGVLIDSGDVTIIGGIFRQSAVGVLGTSVNSRIRLQSTRFSSIVNRPVQLNTTNFMVDGTNFQNWSGSTPVTALNTTITIPGTNSIVIPNQGDFFLIATGAGSSLGNIAYGWPGRMITLKFNNNVTMIQQLGAPGDMYLAGGANFVASTNSTLTLISDGTYWYEIGRSQTSTNREIINAATVSLAANAQADLNFTNGAATYTLLQVGSDYPARIRIYDSTTSRSADASRPVGTDPLPGSGVIAEVITYTGLPLTIPGALTQAMTPAVQGFTANDTNTINVRVTNNDTVTRVITVYLKLVKLEV